MHDQKKTKAPVLSADEKRERDDLFAKFRELYAACFALRDAKDYTRGSLKPLAELLLHNPECYTLWTHRRRVLEHLWSADGVRAEYTDEQLFPQPAAAADGDADAEAAPVAAVEWTEEAKAKAVAAKVAEVTCRDLIAEIVYSTAVIKKEYKCYAAWVHRRWIITSMPGKIRVKVLREENAKLEGLL